MKNILKKLIILEFKEAKENISVYWYFPTWKKERKNGNDN